MRSTDMVDAFGCADGLAAGLGRRYCINMIILIHQC
jgi:hypothetical protein